MACGYSDKENEAIWRARLAAAQFGDVKAAEACKWKPESAITFADDIEAGEDILSPDLFAMISRMIRQDQNALAIHNSFHDSARADRAATKLREVNAENLSGMKRYFGANDFPGTAEIGENGINALLLLIAHADADREFQDEMLEMMNVKVRRGGLPQYIPLILKTIRPQVNESSRSSARPESAPLAETNSETPRQCYYNARSRLIVEYLRDNYRFDD